MKRAALTAALALAFATAAFADVTIKQNVSGKGMGMQQG